MLAEECCSKHVALLLTLCKCYSLIHKIPDHKCKRTRSVTTLSGLKLPGACMHMSANQCSVNVMMAGTKTVYFRTLRVTIPAKV